MPMNTANKLTLLRVFLIPVFLVVAYWGFPGSRYVALAIYIVACLTDLLDGYIARHYNQVSDFGKFADPLADKCLVMAALCWFVETGDMVGWVLAAVLCLHWFNPLVWRMAGQAGRDLELYCDEAVVEGQDSGFRRRYGQVLLQASSGGVTAALTTRLGGTEMKGRIMNLFLQKKKGTALVAAVVCAALLCGGAVAWGPSSAAGAQDLPQEAAARLQQVTESVALNEEGSQVRFTLPELEEGEDWRVQISGRYVAADQVSMSVHLDTPGVWEPRRSYEIPIKPRLRQAE